jgi:thiamine biosynthesis lipoprotein
MRRRMLLGLEERKPPSADHWIRVHRTAMACRFEIALSGEDAPHLAAAREALEEADRVEDRLTVFRDTSEVSHFNARAGRGPVEVSDELFALLERAAALHAAAGGAVDPTATPLLQAWGFLRREGTRPDPGALEAARALVGMQHVELDPAGRTAGLPLPGMQVSFGSLGKGYALDRMAGGLRRAGVPKALLSAGGSSVLAYGGDEGEGFAVDVRSKRASGARLFGLRLRDAAQATSGAGEQFFEVDGQRYGHVLDPRTGWPASGVLSATVVTGSAADADALSTAFLVAGPPLAESYCAGHANTLALLVLEAEPDRLQVFGSHDGASWENS